MCGLSVVVAFTQESAYSQGLQSTLSKCLWWRSIQLFIFFPPLLRSMTACSSFESAEGKVNLLAAMTVRLPLVWVAVYLLVNNHCLLFFSLFLRERYRTACNKFSSWLLQRIWLQVCCGTVQAFAAWPGKVAVCELLLEVTSWVDFCHCLKRRQKMRVTLSNFIGWWSLSGKRCGLLSFSCFFLQEGEDAVNKTHGGGMWLKVGWILKNACCVLVLKSWELLKWLLSLLAVIGSVCFVFFFSSTLINILLFSRLLDLFLRNLSTTMPWNFSVVF